LSGTLGLLHFPSEWYISTTEIFTADITYLFDNQLESNKIAEIFDNSLYHAFTNALYRFLRASNSSISFSSLADVGFTEA